MKIQLSLLVIAAISAIASGSANAVTTLAAFEFPATNSLVATTSGANLTVGNFSISAGSVQENITTGTYFPNEPYVQGSSGWTSTTQTGAKNFSFTITANAGTTFSITNVSFNGYATGAGPAAFGLAIDSTNIASVDVPSASLVTFSQSVTGKNGLSSATIYIQGWDNGSRTTTGSGDFRIDDVLVTGTVVPEPSAALLGALGFLALLRRRR